MDRLHLGTQLAQALRPGQMRGAVGRVNHDAQALQVAILDAGNDRFDVTATSQIAAVRPLVYGSRSGRLDGACLPARVR